MKIVIVSCVSPPEPVVAGRVNWDIAEMFSNCKNEVILITPHPSRPLGKYNFKKKPTDFIKVKNNFTHIRLNSFLYPKYNILFRSIESWDFGHKAIKYINKNCSDADIIYATTWPFLGQYAFIRYNKNRNIPIIMNVQDLYPESIFLKIKHKKIIKLLSALYLVDKYIVNKSHHLTVVSENLKATYIKRRNITPDKITIIENWQDEYEFVKKTPNREILLKKYNLYDVSDKFIFMYLGNIGPVAGLEIVIKEFGLLDPKLYQLIIAGSGTAKESCVDISKKMNLTNVSFIEVPSGLKSVVEIQSVADVLLLPINKSAASSSIPSKLIAYMFSAKPIITSAEEDTDTGKVIKHSNCGWLVNELNPWHKILQKAGCLKSNELKEIGEKGLDYAMQRFSKSIGLKKIEELISEIVSSTLK